VTSLVLCSVTSASQPGLTAGAVKLRGIRSSLVAMLVRGGAVAALDGAHEVRSRS
jgi:hypothetical protein